MSHHSRLQRLADQLNAHQSLWRANPFRDLTPAWIQQHPQLAHQVLSLDDATVAHLEQHPEQALARFADVLPTLGQLAPLLAVPVAEEHAAAPRQGRQFAHIPGRKWQQITAFVGALGQPKAPVLEWCAGKGHLGRLISQQCEVAVTSLEWDQILCQEGEQLALRAALPQQFVCADALTPETANAVKPTQHAVALHACGDLHASLIRHAIKRGTQGLTISPCCYHLTAQSHYRPFSRQGQACQLALSRDELRIAVQETATAPARVQRLRATEMAFRLGYQALIERLAPERRDEGVPSCPKALLGQGFEGFCRWAAERKSVTLGEDVDWPHWQREGEQRWHRLRRLSLVRAVFARPLELFLVLDRVCFLVEQGYHVTLSRFTDRAVTPRNLLIQAELRR
ncbi:conserved hypothetical protein [Ferrimonas balearica DSM 9799]|uniref:Methyltransferase domain-containing protein n=1 Tax=Ferrimonas balearica (strain DSM 9799 / CCM 4581 / KCTC 23876 / PAT) TaxID=550540 RepID=E1ST80_FERBD|nr:methyltransferase [Ferrimonas balearica]ADN76127.1 conserved hypothetical protein [Ferrimonas balearica DSM 9799]